MHGAFLFMNPLTLGEYAGQAQIAIRVANGGLVAYAWAYDPIDKHFDWTTSVHADEESLCRYLRRVIADLYGPDMPEDQSEIGGMEVAV